MFARLQQFILGQPLATDEAPQQTITKPVGLAVFASDMLSSVAYATEEILIVLVAVGVVYFWVSVPIAFAITVLLTILTISYRQTIYAYPNGGGAYTVARDNLGERAAQVAGSALLTDYILTVSVSIAAGVAQITSAFPALIPWKVALSVGAIFFMMIINLRGVKESGRVFAGPTYFFLVMIFGMLAVGFYRFFTGTLPHVTGVEAAPMAVQGLTIFLLLRAFSSGCTAVTGTEAISNGVTSFREPKSKNAALTMAMMSAILGLLFMGITLLAYYAHAIPMEQETIISQLARTIYGTGFFHLLTLAATTVILIMAANTSFAAFPRLAALHAEDGFLPRHLANRGSRLVFSGGIVMLAGFAALLIILFNANVTALIPLYAIGVFLSFTLSQAGMVVHWKKVGRLHTGEAVKTRDTTLRPDPKWRLKQIINGVGAVATFIVAMIFTVSKFALGAWIVVILIPALVFFFFRIHRHYQSVAKQLSLKNPVPQLLREKTVVILVASVHRGTLRAVEFVKLLDPVHTKAVHIALNPDEAEKVKKKWAQWVPNIQLDVVPSPYRDLIGPIISYIEQVERQWEDDTVMVVMPEFIPTKPWHLWLHSQTAKYLRDELEHREDVMIVDVPYRLLDTTE